MKNLFILGFMTAATSMASASPALTCRNIDHASGQGYEAVITARFATIYLDGKKVASLPFADRNGSVGGDQLMVTSYVQNVNGGYSLELSKGAMTGISSAMIYRGGFAGQQLVASLNLCR